MSFANQITVNLDGDAAASPLVTDRINGPSNFKSEFFGDDTTDHYSLKVEHSVISAKPSQGLPERRKHTVILNMVDNDSTSETYADNAKVTIIVDRAITLSEATVDKVVLAALNFVEDPANLAKLYNRES
jgi:hypothetical protein